MRVCNFAFFHSPFSRKLGTRDYYFACPRRHLANLDPTTHCPFCRGTYRMVSTRGRKTQNRSQDTPASPNEQKVTPVARTQSRYATPLPTHTRNHEDSLAEELGLDEGLERMDIPENGKNTVIHQKLC